MNSKQSKAGLILVCFSSICFSLGGLCIKSIPWNAISVNGARSLIALCILSLYMLLSKQKIRINKWIFLGALLVLATNNLFVVATKLTTAANAIVLQFTCPIFTMLLTTVFYHTKPSKLDMIVCLAVLVGIVCFFMESLSIGDIVGNLLAILSGLTYAGMFMMNDFPEGDSLSSTFFGQIMSVCLAVPFLIKENDFTQHTMIFVLILGVFQMGIAYVCFGEGLKRTKPVSASLVSGLEPVLNPVLVAIFAGETLSTMAIIGCVIVLGAVLYYNVRKAMEQRVDNN